VANSQSAVKCVDPRWTWKQSIHSTSGDHDRIISMDLNLHIGNRADKTKQIKHDRAREVIGYYLPKATMKMALLLCVILFYIQVLSSSKIVMVTVYFFFIWDCICYGRSVLLSSCRCVTWFSEAKLCCVGLKTKVTNFGILALWCSRALSCFGIYETMVGVVGKRSQRHVVVRSTNFCNVAFRPKWHNSKSRIHYTAPKSGYQ